MKIKNDNREISKPKGIVTEFKGFEIEEKFQLAEVPPASFLTDLRNLWLENSRLELCRGRESLEWVFHFDYYIFQREGARRQSLVIIHHPSTPKFWIRKKGPPDIFPISGKGFQAWVVRRKEFQTVVDKPFGNREARRIVQKEEARVNAALVPLPRLTREKYYTFLRNSSTGRSFSISLDFCHAQGEIMSQLEIEYKWRDEEMAFGFEEMGSMLEEFKLFTEPLFSSPTNPKCIPTKLTKYEWLAKLAYGSKAKEEKDY